jgi:hypothetical protein
LDQADAAAIRVAATFSLFNFTDKVVWSVVYSTAIACKENREHAVSIPVDDFAVNNSTIPYERHSRPDQAAGLVQTFAYQDT